MKKGVLGLFILALLGLLYYWGMEMNQFANGVNEDAKTTQAYDEANTEIVIKSEEIKIEQSISEATFPFYTKLPYEPIISSYYENGVCLNKTIESLVKKNHNLLGESIFDYNTKELLFHSDPFMTDYKVIKKSDTRIIIEGFVRLPQEGDWDKVGFNEYKIIEYDFCIDENNYTIEAKHVDPKIKFDRRKIKRLIRSMDRDLKCKPVKGGIKGCEKRLEKLEYYMFLDLFYGNREYEALYLELSDKYSRFWGGQYAEYLRGNYMTLYSLGKITPSEGMLKRTAGPLRYLLKNDCD